MDSQFNKGGFFSRSTIKESINKGNETAKLSMWGANKFIEDKSQAAIKNLLFRQSLQRQLADRVEQINSFNTYQLMANFSFLLHPAELPPPFIVSIIAQKVQSQENITIGQIQKMNPQVVQDLVYQAIQQSIAYGRPFLSRAMQYWNQMTNASRKMKDLDAQAMKKYIQQDRKNRFMSVVAKGLNSTINKIAETWTKISSTTTQSALSIWQYLISKADVDPMFAQRFSEATSKIKKYGQFLINGWYVEQNSIKIFVDNEVYYSIPNFPQIRIKIKDDGNMILVAQPDFNQKFLKKILKNKVIQQNAFVLNQYQMVSKPVQGYTSSNQIFQKNYMSKTQFDTFQATVLGQKIKKIQGRMTSNQKKQYTAPTNLTLKSMDQYLKSKQRKMYQTSGFIQLKDPTLQQQQQSKPNSS